MWLKFNVDVVGGSLSHSAHGRIYDNTSTQPYYYYVPSLGVNCAGDMVIGFSGSSATNYIGAFYWWRFANGSMLNRPRLIRAGLTAFTNDRWGDYSATTLDPTDDWSFWTVQEYTDPAGDPHQDGYFPWETVVARIKAGP